MSVKNLDETLISFSCKSCGYCSELVDDAQHTFCHCERWMEDVRSLDVEIEKYMSHTTVMQIMLGSEDY